MARIDPTQLSDRPLETQPIDPRGTDWYRFVQDIENLLAQGTYVFAEDTLRGIQKTVEQTQRVTDNQRRAVENIDRSANRRPMAGWRRRYGGY